MNVVAVVVTYNRKKLLIECLNAILNQKYEVTSIVIIDNASDDGTPDTLRETGLMGHEKVMYSRMEKNLGGAGGFYEGIKRAYLMDADWIWIMDDDSIPEESCLNEMTKMISDEVSFLASSVFGLNGEPMNVPEVDFTVTKNGYSDWYSRLSEGIIRIKNATFVSILINRCAVESVGLPCKEYFIWGDDIEYTSRLVSKYGNAYLVGKSKVCHKRINAKKLDIMQEKDKKRIANYKYYYRNNLLNLIMYGTKGNVIKTIISNYLKAIKVLLLSKTYRVNRFMAIIVGVNSALFRRKKIIAQVNIITIQ